MACSEDLTYGHGDDDLLDELRTAWGDFYNEPVPMVGALLALDEHYGLDHGDEYVLVNPELAVALIAEVTPVDEDIRQAIRGKTPDQFLKIGSSKVFEIKFESPASGMVTDDFPDNVRGKVVRLRVMTEAEAEKLQFMHTVREDGTLIHLPGRPYLSVQEF